MAIKIMLDTLVFGEHLSNAKIAASQVILTFGEIHVTFRNTVKIRLSNRVLTQTEAEFDVNLNDLVGQRVVGIWFKDKRSAFLEFEGGAILCISLDAPPIAPTSPFSIAEWSEAIAI